MVEAPKPSEIQNVLAMDDPQQMLAKLLWEIRELTDAMSAWVDNGEFPSRDFCCLQCSCNRLAHYRLGLAIRA